jgi:hypothetical protein
VKICTHLSKLVPEPALIAIGFAPRFLARVHCRVKRILIALNQIHLGTTIPTDSVGVTVPVLALARGGFCRRHGCHVECGIAPTARTVEVDSNVNHLPQKRQNLEVAAITRRVWEVWSHHEVSTRAETHLKASASVDDLDVVAGWRCVARLVLAVFRHDQTVRHKRNWRYQRRRRRRRRR